MHNVDEMKLYELYYIVYVYSIYEDDDIVPYDMEYVWHKINDYYYQENDILLDILIELLAIWDLDCMLLLSSIFFFILVNNEFNSCT